MATYTGKVTARALQFGPRLYRTGGVGVVRGNVFVIPSQPVARMAYLYEEVTRQLVKKQLTNAATGAFYFDRLRTDVTYMAVVIDHTQVYRAETSDRLTAEVL